MARKRRGQPIHGWHVIDKPQGMTSARVVARVPAIPEAAEAGPAGHEAEAGEGRLGVHMADVSTFVPSAGPLDTEARARGNSVYLPRLVIPMLPEVLSNGVCSLQEGVRRFAKSIFITFDQRGEVIGQRPAACSTRPRPWPGALPPSPRRSRCCRPARSSVCSRTILTRSGPQPRKAFSAAAR